MEITSIIKINDHTFSSKDWDQEIIIINKNEKILGKYSIENIKGGK
jgi:hypothetical protein